MWVWMVSVLALWQAENTPPLTGGRGSSLHLPELAKQKRIDGRITVIRIILLIDLFLDYNNQEIMAGHKNHELKYCFVCGHQNC